MAAIAIICLMSAGLHLLALAGGGDASNSLLNITNNCTEAVWPAMSSSAPTGSASLSSTGFELRPGNSNMIRVPVGWTGRIWGRTSCSTNTLKGRFRCLTGDYYSTGCLDDCAGAKPATPATVAQFHNIVGERDGYDITLDGFGFNIPMLVSPANGGGTDCLATGYASSSVLTCSGGGDKYVITFCPSVMSSCYTPLAAGNQQPPPITITTPPTGDDSDSKIESRIALIVSIVSLVTAVVGFMAQCLGVIKKCCT